jgi:hypothetical protein
MIPYEELVAALHSWRSRNGLPVGPANYLGEPSRRPPSYLGDMPTGSTSEVEAGDIVDDGYDDAVVQAPIHDRSGSAGLDVQFGESGAVAVGGSYEQSYGGDSYANEQSYGQQSDAGYGYGDGDIELGHAGTSADAAYAVHPGADYADVADAEDENTVISRAVDDESGMESLDLGDLDAPDEYTDPEESKPT